MNARRDRIAFERRIPASATAAAAVLPHLASMGEAELKIRGEAAGMGRKRRRAHLQAHGLKQLPPVDVSTPNAPSDPPEPCVMCGAAVEAGQGACRYCEMKHDARTLRKQAHFSGRKHCPRLGLWNPALVNAAS